MNKIEQKNHLPIMVISTDVEGFAAIKQEGFNGSNVIVIEIASIPELIRILQKEIE